MLQAGSLREAMAPSAEQPSGGSSRRGIFWVTGCDRRHQMLQHQHCGFVLLWPRDRLVLWERCCAVCAPVHGSSQVCLQELWEPPGRQAGKRGCLVWLCVLGKLSLCVHATSSHASGSCMGSVACLTRFRGCQAPFALSRLEKWDA